MASRARSEDFKSPECRVSYAHGLFEKRKKTRDDGTAFESHDVTLIFSTKVDRAKLDAAVKEVIVGEWGEKGLQMAKDKLIKSPFLAGDGKEARNKETGDLHPGMGPDVFFIRPSSQKDIVVRYKSANIPATKDEIKSGDYGFAALHCYAWENPKNGKGVSFGISYFQKTRDGESLGGSTAISADQWFEKIDDNGDAPDTGGAGAGGLFGD
jgi:hypothetical protein